MKHLVTVCSIFVAIFVTTIAYAGPFGIDMGMQLKDFKGQITKIGNGVYLIPEVPKAHPSFTSYAVCVSPTGGVYEIRAMTADIVTNVYGNGLVTKFKRIEASLGAKYGKGENIDYLKSGSIWNEPKDFTRALQKEERLLLTYWEVKDGKTLGDNIVMISLQAECSSANKGDIRIGYKFANADKGMAEVKAVSDQAL